MPIELLLLLALLALVVVLFIFVKRPIYEALAFAFVFVVIVSGQWDQIISFLVYPATSSLFYIIFAFLVVAAVFDATGAVNRIIKVLLALIGRLPGGAGYVALMASTFMASLSGTGPGNVAASGVFTIPLMKRTGFPRHLAATTEMSASMLGNIIPPSGIVFLSLAIYQETTGNTIAPSVWLMAAYIIGGWFFLQRLFTLFVLAKINKVEPVPRDELPSLRESLKEGWSALLLPMVIFVPLALDAVGGNFLELRLGEGGAEAFSGAVLMFTPGLAAAYAILIGRRQLRRGSDGAQQLFQALAGSLKAVVPVSATIYFAYATSEAFGSMGGDEAIEQWFVSLELPLWSLYIVLPLFFALLGMVLPGSAQIAILGGAMIGVVGALGGDPLLLAVLLPAITGALEGMTPPLALGLYVATGIAESNFAKTVKYAFLWIVPHLILSMLLLAGILPIFVI
jgi:C4-dicarboxylate transporter, DctM subunit